MRGEEQQKTRRHCEEASPSAAAEAGVLTLLRSPPPRSGAHDGGHCAASCLPVLGGKWPHKAEDWRPPICTSPLQQAAPPQGCRRRPGQGAPPKSAHACRKSPKSWEAERQYVRRYWRRGPQSCRGVPRGPAKRIMPRGQRPSKTEYFLQTSVGSFHPQHQARVHPLKAYGAANTCSRVHGGKTAIAVPEPHTNGGLLPS